jgi:hypothetical protein
MKQFILIVTLLAVVSAPVSLFSQEKKEKKEKIVVVDETLTPELNVVNNILYVKNARIGSHLEIITIVGNKVCDFELKSVSASYELNLPKAIYIFKLEGVVRKFVIK